MPGQPERDATNAAPSPVRIGRNFVTLLPFVIPLAITAGGLWLGIEGGAEQVRLGAPPMVWVQTYIGAAVWGLFLVRLLGRVAAPNGLLVTGDALILRGSFRRRRLPWADIEWIGVLPAAGEAGAGKRSRCPADLLILLATDQTSQPALPRRGRLRWDPDWDGIRFCLVHLDVTPQLLGELMTDHAGPRWHGVSSLPVTAGEPDGAGAVLSVPGHLCSPLLNSLKNASVGIGMLFFIFSLRVYASPNSFSFNAPSEHESLLVIGATASSAFIIINALMILAALCLISRCWMVVTDAGIEVTVGGFADHVKWRAVSKLEISVTGPRSRRRNAPWALTAHFKPEQQGADYPRAVEKWGCFTVQSTGVVQVVPVHGLIALHHRHGLNVFPEQLAEALREFKPPVSVVGPAQASAHETQWRRLANPVP
jgi:hypothetical protein